MVSRPSALLLWDGTNKVFHDQRYIAPVLESYGVEFLAPELGGTFPATEDMLISALQGVDAFFASSEWVTRHVMEEVPSLKLVQRIGVGYDKVDVEAATDLGILVGITAGSLSVAVAEHTFALMLAVAGRIPSYDRDVKAGVWAPGLRDDLRGATLGLLGMGRIGKEVVKLAPAFGMRVLGYDPVWDEEFAYEYSVTKVDMPTLLASSDFVALCLPLSERTEGLLGKEELSLTKPGAYLINTARGALVDELAVAQALEEGRLGGYATDVFVEKPPSPDLPLFRFDNVVVTPHVAAASRGANQRTNSLAAECVGRVLTGEDAPDGCVLNPEVRPHWRGNR